MLVIRSIYLFKLYIFCDSPPTMINKTKTIYTTQITSPNLLVNLIPSRLLLIYTCQLYTMREWRRKKEMFIV